MKRDLKLCIGLLASTCMTVLLLGCGKEPQRPGSAEPVGEPVKQAEVADIVPPTDASNAVTSQLLGMRILASEDAPFACDTLSAGDIENIIGAETEVFDVSEKRKSAGAAVDSTCLYAYGEDKNPDSIRLKAKFVRVDVYTDANIKAAGWGTLHEEWLRRSEDNKRRFDLIEGVWAAWVDSDHPPDPALLVRQGDVMFEVAYFPPSSSPGTREENAKIEKIAATLIGNQSSQ